MKYGVCTYFSAKTNDTIDYNLLHRISDAGFDYIEFPLFLIDNLSDKSFENLISTLEDMSLKTLVCSNLFPDNMVITGPKADQQALRFYLIRTLNKAYKLGIRKIVFANISSWQVPEGINRLEGYKRLVELLREVIIPICEKYNFIIMIEPLRKTICNLINTLEDGMTLVRQVRSPYVKLIADIYHMLNNKEAPEQICSFSQSIEHVHIAELGRLLPENAFSKDTHLLLQYLKTAGYNKTISFETIYNEHNSNLKNALNLLKSVFDC